MAIVDAAVVQLAPDAARTIRYTPLLSKGSSDAGQTLASAQKHE
jgi:hypothetical protein